MAFPPARPQTWGIKPFIITPPTSKELLELWIDAEDFKQLPLEVKRMYAFKFRVPNTHRLYDKHLDALFCRLNKKLPMFSDILEFGLDPNDLSRRVLRGIDFLPDDDEEFRFSGNPDDPDYAPWLPSQSLLIEKLQPSPDDYEDGRIPAEDDAEPEWMPPTRIEHELVYPPRAPVVRKDKKTGRDIVQPLSQDWLHAMMDEQASRYETLKSALQEAMLAVREAVTEVTLLQAQVKIEQGQFDNFLAAIDKVSGWEVVETIKELTRAGVDYNDINSRAGKPAEDSDSENSDDFEDDDVQENDLQDDDEQGDEDDEAEGADGDKSDPIARSGPGFLTPPAEEVVQDEENTATHPAQTGSPILNFVSRMRQTLFPKRSREDDAEDADPDTHLGDETLQLSDDEPPRPRKKARRASTPAEYEDIHLKVLAMRPGPLQGQPSLSLKAKPLRRETERVLVNEDNGACLLVPRLELVDDVRARWAQQQDKMAQWREEGGAGGRSRDSQREKKTRWEDEGFNTGISYSYTKASLEADDAEARMNENQLEKKTQWEDEGFNTGISYRYTKASLEADEAEARRNEQQQEKTQWEDEGFNTGISYRYTKASLEADEAQDRQQEKKTRWEDEGFNTGISYSYTKASLEADEAEARMHEQQQEKTTRWEDEGFNTGISYRYRKASLEANEAQARQNVNP